MVKATQGKAKRKKTLLKPRSWYTKKLSTLAKSCAKQRDGYICQMCGKECQGSDAHGSHVLNVGGNKNLELDPVNIKCLCSYCHLYRWHKDILKSAEWFKQKFPERFTYLEILRAKKIHFSTVELAELYDKVKSLDWRGYAKEYFALVERKEAIGALKNL